MSEMKKIPQRSEIAQEDKWAIEDLYATDEAWSADLEKLKTMTQELAAYAGHLAENPAKLLAYLEETEAVGVLTEDLANYCMRKSDEDTPGRQVPGNAGSVYERRRGPLRRHQLRDSGNSEHLRRDVGRFLCR